jgi:hypothetical protein
MARKGAVQPAAGPWQRYPESRPEEGETEYRTAARVLREHCWQQLERWQRAGKKAFEHMSDTWKGIAWGHYRAAQDAYAQAERLTVTSDQEEKGPTT